VIESTWNQFNLVQLGYFNKTIFHYLLSRLADLKRPLAHSYVVDVLRERPEETEVCLRHLGAFLPLAEKIVDGLAAILVDDDTLFEHQRWCLLRWFVENSVRHEAVRSFARKNVSVRAPYPLLRFDAIIYLGKMADGRHDLDRIRDALHEETEPTVKACLLTALALGPKDVYGTELSRAGGETQFADWAIEYAKQAAAAVRGKG